MSRLRQYPVTDYPHRHLIRTREGRVRIACEMRERGHTIDEIARSVGVCPATASMYVYEGGGLRLTTMDVRPIRGTLYRPPKKR